VRTQRVLWTLTLVNLVLLAVQVVARGDPPAKKDDGFLRGRGLEILDEQGRVRMQVKVEPANATFPMPDGTKGYPETVILRLITADGKPRVKLTTSVPGSGLMLLGDSDTTQAILSAEGAKTRLRLRNDETKDRLLEP
jgi:hypothetical protein